VLTVREKKSAGARARAKRKKALRDIAITTLDMQRFEFEERGDDRAILSAVNLCAVNNISLPTWLANAFTKKFRDVEAFKYSSWDAAFGRPYSLGSKTGKRGAGAKRQARQVHKELEIPVWLKIRELAAMGIKTTDDLIFRQAADVKGGGRNEEESSLNDLKSEAHLL
jgi:hypothetical protein